MPLPIELNPTVNPNFNLPSGANRGTNVASDNKLNLVPCTIKESMKVVDMDPIIDEEAGLENVIENEPWLVDQKPFFVQRWVVGICLDKHDQARIPLWVKIYNIPLKRNTDQGRYFMITFAQDIRERPLTVSFVK
nr:RNA-directed DNA polymerase, eukaryota, reverse transcriptase zinc-binding domain protein [Tanacetum cinerariifolium]